MDQVVKTKLREPSEIFQVAPQGIGVTTGAGAGKSGKTTLIIALTAYAAMKRVEKNGIKLPFEVVRDTLSKNAQMSYAAVSHSCSFMSFILHPEVSSAIQELETSVSRTSTKIDDIEAKLTSFMTAHKTELSEALIRSTLVDLNDNTREARVRKMLAMQKTEDFDVPTLSRCIEIVSTSEMHKRCLINDDVFSALLYSSLNLRQRSAEASSLVESVCVVADLLKTSTYAMSSVKNESTIEELGLQASLESNSSLGYVISFPGSNNPSDPYKSTRIEAYVTVPPMHLAKAFTFFSVCRIGTLNGVFGIDIKHAKTLKGGLDESVGMIQQELNDLLIKTGGVAFIELRDDYIVSGSGAFDIMTGAPDPAAMARLTSSSRIGIYLTDLGRASVRLRAYDEEEAEMGHDVVEYSLGDLPGVNPRTGMPDWEKMFGSKPANAYGDMLRKVGAVKLVKDEV